MARWIVPDSCALAASIYNEPHSANADPMLDAIRRFNVEAVAPSLGLAEFLNISRKKLSPQTVNGVTYPALPATVVDAAVADFLNLPILWVDTESIVSTAWHLHRTHAVQTGDAFFLALGMSWGAELWTTDVPFAKRAKAVYPNTFDLQAIAFS